MSHMYLPEILETASAPDLLEQLKTHSGDILLDGSQVKRLGGRCFEILLSARKTVVLRNKRFAIRNPSPELKNALTLMGGESLLTEGNVQ